MTALAIVSPLPQFFDLDGAPLTGGSLYFGAANDNPETAPQTVYWDQALTQPAAQPISTRNGYAVRSGTVSPVYVAADYSLTVRDRLGRQVMYAANSADFTNIASAAAALAAYQALLAGTGSSQGASQIGMEDGGTVAKALKYRINVTAMPGFSAAAALPAFQAAITTLTALGGGTIVCPPLDYVLAVAAESDCLAHTVPIWYDVAPGATFSFSYYPLPLFVWVGVDGGGMNGGEIIFTGTRPGSTAGLTSNHFGYNATGVESPTNFAAFIGVLGSNNVKIDGVSWRGSTTSNLKESGIMLAGGTSTGPSLDGGTILLPGANAVYNTGNRITNCTSNDVYFGIAGNMQDGCTVDGFKSDRYNPSGFVGAGHAIYTTGAWKNSRVSNCIDVGTCNGTPGAGTFAGNSSYQFRSFSNGIIENLRSSRPEGFGSLQNNCNNNIVRGLHWSADRVPYETALSGTPVWNVAQSDATSTQNDNLISDVYFEDKFNSGSSRSSNCPMMGNGGATVVSANMVGNVLRNFNVTFYPDASYNKSVITWPGQNTDADFRLWNLGTGLTARDVIQFFGSAAGTWAKNDIHVTFLGNQRVSYNLAVTNSAGNNRVSVHGSGLLLNSAATGMVAGDKLVTDVDSYATRADLVSSQVSHTYMVTLTGNITIPVPAAELAYTGSVIDFTFSADAARVITWNAIFLKAADGAAAAGKSASTRFRYNGTNWVQQGGALTYN